MSTVSNSHLLSWLKLFWTTDGALTYDSILDAFFLNEVFREIDQNATANEQLSSNDSLMDKIKNWEILIKNIRIYYAEVLQQAIVVRLPSIVAICHEKNTEKFQKEIDKAIFLILGAAVQCEKKEYFIQDIITRLPDQSIQHGLMGVIKQITENVDMVINYQNLSEFSITDLVFHLRNILERREDTFLEDHKSLLLEIDDLHRQINDQKNQMQVMRNVGLDNNGTINLQSNKGIAVELAEYKVKLRKIQNELDDKNDIISDLRNELDLQQDENCKLKEAQMKAINESRRTRLLQDELDSFKESIIRLPIIESENVRLKEKVNELEYYRARCEELREDLAIISNENTDLRDKIENNSKLVEQSLKFESEYRKTTRKIEELEQVRSQQNIELAKLETELRSLQEKDVINLSNKSELSSKLKALQKGNDDNLSMSSISDQVMEKTNAKILRLEIENRALKETLAEDNRIEMTKLQETISELEAENTRLSNRASRLQEVNKIEIQKLMEVEESKQLVLREKQQLELDINSTKENEARKMKELIQENESLSETIMIIRERSEKSNDLRLIELEKENSKLHSSLNEVNHKVSALEFDLQRSLQKSTRLDQSLEKSQQDYLLLSKQNGDLNKEITTLRLFKTRLEELQDKFSALEVDKLRLEALVQEYSQQLAQNVNVLDAKSDEELKLLATENHRKTSQLLNKISELESELLKSRTENDKCTRSNATNEKRNKALLQELDSYKVELANMSRLESKLKLAEKNLEELEKEREQLQSQNLKLDQDLKKIDKENRRMKNHSEVQTSSIDNHKSRIADLEKKLYLLELKQVDKDEVDSIKVTLEESEKRILDSEKKNRELLLQIKEEKRKCTTLREELLKERLVSQNLRNQVQILTEEFEKIGFSDEEASVEKFKELESMMNSTVDNTAKKSDERIVNLQSNLASLTTRNKEVSVQLSEMTSKYQAMQSKYEEELNLRLLRNNSMQNSKDIPAYTQYLVELKDEIGELKRQNATIGSEKQFLGDQCQDLKEKINTMETKHSKELEKLQKRFDELNNENMKLQIEVSTLKSQLETLRNDNKYLADQISTNQRNLTTSVDEINNSSKVASQLESQCSSLQRLNEQLSSEYDRVKAQLNQQTAQNRKLKSDFETQSVQFEKMKKSYDSVKHLQDSLENEKNNLADGAQQLINLRIENSNINEDYNDLLKKSYKLENDLKNVVHENKILRSEYNSAKSSMVKSADEKAKLEQQINLSDKEIGKLESRVESLTEQIDHLKEENSKLLHQMKSMLMQNQELLTETLKNKQNHFSEEVELRERLNNLQRHKERLEEKIMEQYKTIPSTKKPKGASNKFLRKAKEMLKRRDSRSSADKDRQNSVEVLTRNQRSRSCVTIIGDEPDSIKTGDRSSDYHNEDSEISDRNIVESDSDVSELDLSGPVPKLKVSRQSDVDSTSMLSSVSQRVHSYKSNQPVQKLVPGSMSIYDRDESEKKGTSELNEFFLKMHNQKLDEEKKEAEKTSGRESKTIGDTTPVAKQPAIVKTVIRGNQRPQSVNEISYQNRRALPNQPISVPGPTNGPSSALTFGNISSKQTDNQGIQSQRKTSKDNTSIVVLPTKTPVNQYQPGIPARKVSLPVTDRVEEEFSDADEFGDFSPRTLKQSPQRRSDATPRPQSTTPATASSKEILQRLQRTAGRNTPVSNDLRLRQRAQIPTGLVKQPSNNNTNGSNYSDSINCNQESVNVKSSNNIGASAPILRMNVRNRNPQVPQRMESSLRPGIGRPAQPEPIPVPPVRRDSGKTRTSVDNSSSISDNSEHQKPKVFYQYGHV